MGLFSLVLILHIFLVELRKHLPVSRVLGALRSVFLSLLT